MAEVLRQHPQAGRLFQTGQGTAEVSIFWRDPIWNIWRRARYDWVTEIGGRLVIVDYKSTSKTARPDADGFGKTIHNFGYHQQAAWYRDGAIHTGWDEDPDFIFVAQENTPPYLVSVLRLDSDAYLLAERENMYALQMFVACKGNDYWPGYPDGIHTVSLPRYATKGL
jgi:hypothetical protein